VIEHERHKIYLTQKKFWIILIYCNFSLWILLNLHNKHWREYIRKWRQLLNFESRNFYYKYDKTLVWEKEKQKRNMIECCLQYCSHLMIELTLLKAAFVIWQGCANQTNSCFFLNTVMIIKNATFSTENWGSFQKEKYIIFHINLMAMP